MYVFVLPLSIAFDTYVYSIALTLHTETLTKCKDKLTKCKDKLTLTPQYQFRSSNARIPFALRIADIAKKLPTHRSGCARASTYAQSFRYARSPHTTYQGQAQPLQTLVSPCRSRTIISCISPHMHRP